MVETEFTEFSLLRNEIAHCRECDLSYSDLVKMKEAAQKILVEYVEPTLTYCRTNNAATNRFSALITIAPVIPYTLLTPPMLPLQSDLGTLTREDERSPDEVQIKRRRRHSPPVDPTQSSTSTTLFFSAIGAPASTATPASVQSSEPTPSPTSSLKPSNSE